MKRHTLFIYIAALLTMLGTALPMSAQNKSFTVNRNDGASQKYSYSQGDRLVLSREDSQGKKHADFVEQQVYVGNDVHNFPLTSIESITFDAQATEDEGKTFTVQESGGKIEYDDITIDFPSGTFNSATKVTISEVEKGKMDGENEMSKFYKVKLSGGIRRNFKPAIKSNEFANDDVVKMMFISEAWAPSTNENGYAKKMANVAYANDAYYTEIPAMERPELADGAEVYFGLVYNKIDLSSSARTRDDNLEEGMDEDFILHGNFHSDLEKKIKECIRQALDKLKQLGFGAMKYEKINYYVEDFIVFSDAWGCYNKSKLWGPEAGSISLNQNKFPVLVYQILSFNFTELQKSIIHETMHYFQAYYYNNTSHNTGTILEEATAVWSERFYGYKLSTEYTVGNLPLFIASLNPEHGDVHWGGITEAGSPQWIFRYQNVGYGASALIEYLAQIFDDKIIDEMFDDRLERDDHLNTIGIIEKMAQKRGLDIFRQDNYKDFIEKLGCREVYSYKSKEPYVHFESMIQNRKVQDDIGVVTRIIRDQNPVYFTNYAYGYGALVEKLVVDGKNYTTISSNGLDNTIATIKQTTEGVKTWVYRLLKGNSLELLGMMEKGNTLDISYTFDSDPDAQYTYYLVTIPNDFKTSENILSRIEAKVIKENDMIRIEPDKIEFDADGGSKYLDIYTKMPSFKYEKDKDWPSWLKVESYKDFTMKVTAEPNTSSTERKYTITVYALDAKGNKVGQPAKVEVTQNLSFLLNVEPNPITLPGYGSEFKNGKMTGSFTVKYIKDAKSVNVRVEFEQDDKDKSWLTLDGDWASQTSDDMLFICKRNFTVTPNTSFTKPRSAKIIVELTMPDGSKPDPEIVPVTQEPMKGVLSIAPDQLLLKAEEYAGAEYSDRQEVTITTNLLDEAIEKFVFKEEKLSPSKGWLKYEHKEKSKTIVIYADAYPEEKTPRDGIIYYSIVTTDGKEFPASVKVIQQGRGAGALFTINPSTIRFEAKASEMLVKVEGENVEGISSFDVQWPSWLGGAHSTLGKTLSLTATQNESKEERSKVFTLTVKMKNGDLVSRQFVAYQDGANDDEDPDAPYIAINSSLTFSNKGGSETVKYSTNQPDIAWETNCYWLTIEKTSDGLLVSAKPNLGNKDSSAKIIVYALDKYKNKVADVTINVKQQKGDGYKILVGKYYHERTKTVRDPEQGKYVETVEWYDELSITESSYTIKHVSNTNPSASYTKTGNLKISKLEVYRLTPAMDESMGIFNRDVSNWTDYDGYYMGGKFNIDGVDSGFTGSYIESSRYGHSYKLIYPIGGGDIHYKISNDPNDPILP